MPTPLLSTYRLQFQPGFGFEQAADIVPYLSALGISHIYASPIFRARPGSRHGYDVVDPNALNPDLGSRQAWETLVDRLHAHNMGWIQDIVPNHMAFDAGNRMLTDVLENGSASRFYGFFDICWVHPSKILQGRLMAPFLGRRYAECLENGDIGLSYGAGGFAATYGGLTFPLRIETYLHILNDATFAIKNGFRPSDPAYQRWIDLLDNLESLVLQVDAGLRQDQVDAIKLTLWDLYDGHRLIRYAIASTLRKFNGHPGDIDSYRRLDQLLWQQCFRLCHWRVANAEINYRRFFDINELIALNQESKAVFEHTHALLLELAAAEHLDGVRIDHIDGLADPADYLQRLRRYLPEGTIVFVEKILAAEEVLPADWPVDGTTGYDFAHWLNALFVQRENEARFSGIYTRFSRCGQSFEAIVVMAKKEILSARLAGDLDNLAWRVKAISARKPFADNLTFERLKEALSEVLARFPVYRTYLGHTTIRDADRGVAQTALSSAAGDRPDLHVEFTFIGNLLLDGIRSVRPGGDDGIREACRRAVRAFQQLSAALMAKGVEDTAFYRYHRLVSLNEVGGEPGRFGCSSEQFHDFIARRVKRWPQAMNATATHDTKRGEEVRARLNVLSEIPDEWEARIDAWHSFNRGRRIRIDGEMVPDENTEYLLYQTLIGTWPLNGRVTDRFKERIKAYMTKASREAGRHTTWVDANESYETALTAFVDKILEPSPQNAFLPDVEAFCRKIAWFGVTNSLSQCLLKITAPGVPDFYQGTELPQLALVDPDNRRQVAFDERRHLLEAMRDDSTDPLATITGLLENRHDGKVKLFLIKRALSARRQSRDLFESGDYLPLATGGRFGRHIVAFARISGRKWYVAVVPRLLTSMVEAGQDPLGPAVWGDSTIRLPQRAPHVWHNLFTRQQVKGDAEIMAAEAFRHFPVALLAGGQGL